MEELVFKKKERENRQNPVKYIPMSPSACGQLHCQVVTRDHGLNTGFLTGLGPNQGWAYSPSSVTHYCVTLKKAA